MAGPRLERPKRQLTLTSPTADPVHRFVADDAQEPRPKRSTIFEPVQCLICLHERILGNVLSLRVIARDQVRNSYRHALIAAYEFVVRPRIPLPGSTDQFRLVQRLTSRFLHRRSAGGSREPLGRRVVGKREHLEQAAGAGARGLDPGAQAGHAYVFRPREPAAVGTGMAGSIEVTARGPGTADPSTAQPVASRASSMISASLG